MNPFKGNIELSESIFFVLFKDGHNYQHILKEITIIRMDLFGIIYLNILMYDF